MAKILISKEQLARNQTPILIVVLVLGVCREFTSLLAGLAFLRGLPMRPSRLKPTSLCGVEREPRLLHGSEESRADVPRRWSAWDDGDSDVLGLLYP